MSCPLAMKVGKSHVYDYIAAFSNPLMYKNTACQMLHNTVLKVFPYFLLLLCYSGLRERRKIRQTRIVSRMFSTHPCIFSWKND